MAVTRSGSLAGIVLVMALSLPVAGCSGTPADTTADSAVLLERRCTSCHGIERVDGATKDRAAWIDTIDRMRSKGAKVTDSETQQLADYLAKRGAKK